MLSHEPYPESLRTRQKSIQQFKSANWGIISVEPSHQVHTVAVVYWSQYPFQLCNNLIIFWNNIWPSLSRLAHFDGRKVSISGKSYSLMLPRGTHCDHIPVEYSITGPLILHTYHIFIAIEANIRAERFMFQLHEALSLFSFSANFTALMGSNVSSLKASKMIFSSLPDL